MHHSLTVIGDAAGSLNCTPPFACVLMKCNVLVEACGPIVRSPEPVLPKRFRPNTGEQQHANAQSHPEIAHPSFMRICERFILQDF